MKLSCLLAAALVMPQAGQEHGAQHWSEQVQQLELLVRKTGCLQTRKGSSPVQVTLF